MKINWRSEYALGSDQLTIFQSIKFILVAHTIPPRNFINLRKLKNNNDQQLLPYGEDLRKAIKAAAGKPISQGGTKSMAANISAKHEKCEEREELHKKLSEQPQK